MSRSINAPSLVVMMSRCFGKGSDAAGGLAFGGCAPDSARADVAPDSLRRGVRVGRLRGAGAGFGVAAAADSVFVSFEGWSEAFAPVFLASSVSDFVGPGFGVGAPARVRLVVVLAPAPRLAAEDVVRRAGVAAAGAGVGFASSFASSL